MEAGSSQPTISGTARKCLLLFRECLGGMAALDPKSLHILTMINDPLFSHSHGEATVAYTSAIEPITDEVRKLRDRTQTIRREIRKADEAEDAVPSILTDENDDDIEESLTDHLAADIQSQFPNLSDIIRLRLAKSMVLRRKRIMFKRLCYAEDPISMTQTTARPSNSTQTRRRVIKPQIAQRAAITSQRGVITPRASGSQTKGRNATPKRVQMPETPPVEFQLKSMALEPHEDLIFPLLPSHSPKAIEVMCPFCSVLLPVKEITDDYRWREHVKSDLDPYICLAENCDCPDEIYKHSNDWLKHMRKHVLRWMCASRAHGEMLFDTREDYVSHMKLHHRKAVTDRRIDALADISLQMTGPLFESCPFCGIEEQDANESLGEHIAGHLRYLAIQSLPPANNGSEEASHVAKNEEMDYEMTTRKEVGSQAYSQDITTFLHPASITSPEARLAIKYHCHAGKAIFYGKKEATDIDESEEMDYEMSTREKPGQSRLVYVAQQPGDVDYNIDIPLEKPLPHYKATTIKLQIVYDPGSDDCILINRTGALLALFRYQGGLIQVLTFNGVVAIQPGMWEIKLHLVDDTTDNGCLVEIWLRGRRHTIAIAQPNDELQNQEIEDSKISTKRQKVNASLTKDIVRHASNSATDWKLLFKNSAESNFFELQDGGFATIYTPFSMTEFQTEHCPTRYRIKRINKISDKPASKMFRCEHSLISRNLALKVFKYQDKSPRDLIKLSELWQHEKDILNKLNHGNIVKLEAFDGRMLALFFNFLPPSLAQRRDSPFIPSDISNILKTTSSALTYLGANGIVHNNIKPSNIAYSPFEGAVIFDFESASSSNETKLCGAPWYLPPELATDSRRSPAGDVWAFGIIMLYLLNKIKYPETMVKGWDIHEMRRRGSKAAKQMDAWLNLIGKAREDLDQANLIEHMTFRMLDQDQYLRIRAAAIKDRIELMQ